LIENWLAPSEQYLADIRLRKIRKEIIHHNSICL